MRFDEKRKLWVQAKNDVGCDIGGKKSKRKRVARQGKRGTKTRRRKT